MIEKEYRLPGDVAEYQARFLEVHRIAQSSPGEGNSYPRRHTINFEKIVSWAMKRKGIYTMQPEENIKNLYEEALESFVSKVKQDRNFIAAILYGSLSYDEVWEKSDIDVWLIAREGKKGEESYCLVENGVNIHVAIIPRSQFLAPG